MSRTLIVSISVIIGLIFLGVSLVYFIEPAKSLPSFLPGYDPHLARHHYTHAIGTLVLGLVAFAFAWFQSGGKSAQ